MVELYRRIVQLLFYFSVINDYELFQRAMGR